MRNLARLAALACLLLLPSCAATGGATTSASWVSRVEIRLDQAEEIQQAALLAMRVADVNQDGIVRGIEFLSFGFGFWIELQRILAPPAEEPPPAS